MKGKTATLTVQRGNRLRQRKYMSTLERAISIASQAHQGQKDKADMPYILHPLRLMLRMESETGMIAAVLHDIVEDTSWTFDDLREEGFPEDVLAAVECLTRRDEESYEEFIARAKDNPVAKRVKIADLEDNMNVKRLSTVTEKDVERLKKYHRAWLVLTETKSLVSQNGSRAPYRGDDEGTD